MVSPDGTMDTDYLVAKSCPGASTIRIQSSEEFEPGGRNRTTLTTQQRSCRKFKTSAQTFELTHDGDSHSSDFDRPENQVSGKIEYRAGPALSNAS
jgi:hypothetical protein